jgi:hypothetical protein
MTESAAGSTPALGRALIDEFGRGWSKARVDLMMGVFAPEAVFVESPFAAPLRGLDAVRGYWADVPLHQAEITFLAGEIFTVGPWFATEFKCTFRRRRTGAWIDARGAIFCETNGEKITEMRMYWERR